MLSSQLWSRQLPRTESTPDNGRGWAVCAACGDHHGLRDRRLSRPSETNTCTLCSKNVYYPGTFYVVQSDMLWVIEAKNVLREAVANDVPGALASWAALYQDDRKERTNMAAILATKYGLP